MRIILCAFLFVLPLYLVWIFEILFQIQIPLILNSCFALISLYIFLSIPKQKRFSFGFFVGLFWFYWVGFSFIYFGFSYLVPIISIIVAGIYMLIFSFALWFNNLIYRAFSLLVLSYIHPFTFDWMNIDSFFAYSYFGVSKSDFFLLILAVLLFKIAQMQKMRFYFALSGLFLCFALDKSIPYSVPFKIDLIQTDFSQNLKWQTQNAKKNTEMQIAMIIDSIKKGNEIIVLPETAFPFLLEKTSYFQTLKKLSTQSTLVVGAIREENSQLFNSTYIFQNEEVQVFDKVVLAPFGEKIPLPDFLAKYLQKIFLGNEPMNFSQSKDFGSFYFNQQKIKSVICYEGTNPLAYLDFPKYLIVISNNAWFPYTIESALQKNLMKYYSKLYTTIIFHSSNGSPSFVIFP